jgi:hypothetical protein
MAGYEYAHLSTYATSGDLHGLVRQLNDLAVGGWELVSSHSVDKTVGFNGVTTLIRRELAPLPPPANTAADWYPDPSGRWDGRYWNGQAWTYAVARRGEDDPHRDPPTTLTPTPGLNQYDPLRGPGASVSWVRCRARRCPGARRPRA